MPHRVPGGFKYPRRLEAQGKPVALAHPNVEAWNTGRIRPGAHDQAACGCLEFQIGTGVIAVMVGVQNVV